MIPIYWEKYIVGHLDIDGHGAAFIYEPRWVNTQNAFPLSLQMPLSIGRHEPGIVMPWLSNLLPEAEALSVIGRRLGVAQEDVIGLLTHIGHDTAGGMSIGAPRQGERPEYRVVPDSSALERIINDLPAKPFLAGEEGVSMSLAGVQDKIPVAVVDGQICIPTGGAPSTHILKPDSSQRLFGSVENEALCLTLAKHCELAAAAVTTGVAGNRRYLLVSRYDRQPRPEGGWYRLHQEDFNQALGKPPSAKYERNQSGIKGPRLADMFAVVDRHMTASDRTRLLDAVIFNVLIDNTDTHAKNYSIMLSGRGASLAPLYDLMCASCWNVTRNMAQTIGGKDRGDHILGRHWQRMADECGFNRTMILGRVDLMTARVLSKVDTAAAEVATLPGSGPAGMLEQFTAAIRKRCKTVHENLRQAEGH
ncbi:MAG: type II toxin-antitoxin system HipA family toxin [Acidobacteriaceae bacterium]|nr:type II toxin-antitoxin system HipA family toxin [Acidobacteriaceae bacterium]